MIKNLRSTTLLLLLFNINSFAQNPLPNAGFETWSVVGIYENPSDWNTLNPSTSPLGVLTALKASGSDVHSGTNAIKLITKTVLSLTANGIATTGVINTTTQTISGGIPYTGRPDSISGWYKYTPVGGDNGFLAFVLLDASNDTIGFANFTTPNSTVSSYTYFSVAVNYYNTGTPVTARCLLSSSAGFTAVVNSTMFIDDLALIFNTTGTREELPTANTVLKYFSSSKKISIHSASVSISKAEILDISGKKIESYPLHSTKAEFTLENIKPGIYMVLLYDESMNMQLSKKILVE